MRALVGFAGFGGVDIALREAGYDVTGIEIEPTIADVNRLNGGHCLTADILTIDPAEYAGWELYHFSPPCPSFSLANQASSESDLDIALARKIARFIVVGQPKFFTLENVWLYRKSKSWSIILEALQGMSYGVSWWHLNAADYGVAQSRKRMIVIARWDGRQPAKPWPTHSKAGDMFTSPWRGWYEAIEDLIPDLPETQPAQWQIDRMPDELKDSFLIGHSAQREASLLTEARKPAYTITCNSTRSRAFILGQGEPSSLKPDVLPADTVTANTNRAGVKAFIVGSQNSGGVPGKRGITICPPTSPITTILATGAGGSIFRAYLPHSGRWVSMTPRALACFQDFPRWFQLPDNRELACRGIGNALPPGMYRAVERSIRD